MSKNPSKILVYHTTLTHQNPGRREVVKVFLDGSAEIYRSLDGRGEYLFYPPGSHCDFLPYSEKGRAIRARIEDYLNRQQ